mgnify:CR=1 FL=1
MAEFVQIEEQQQTTITGELTQTETIKLTVVNIDFRFLFNRTFSCLLFRKVKCLSKISENYTRAQQVSQMFRHRNKKIRAHRMKIQVTTTTMMMMVINDY